MMSGIFIKNPLAILTEMDSDAGGGLVVRGNEIVELVPAGTEPKQPYDKIFEAGRHVVLPGLINTHHHFYQTLTRALPAAMNKELFDWLNSLYPIWAKLTPEHVALSTRLSLTELLLSGCTTASGPGSGPSRLSPSEKHPDE